MNGLEKKGESFAEKRCCMDCFVTFVWDADRMVYHGMW